MKAADLARMELLRELSAEEREAVSKELEAAALAEGDVLYHEGDEADGLVLLLEGQLRISSLRSGTAGVVGPGAALGALSLVALGAREATAVADSSCRLLWLRRLAFRRLVEDAPRAACRLLEAATCEFVSSVRQGIELLVPPR